MSVVNFALRLAGDVSSFTPSVLTEIRNAIAALAGVDPSAVTVTVVSGSLMADVSIDTPTAVATSVQSVMSSATSSPSSATAMFVNVTGVSIAVLEVVTPPTVTDIAPPPPPPPSSPSPLPPPQRPSLVLNSAVGGATTILVIAVLAATAVLVCCLVACLPRLRTPCCRPFHRRVAPMVRAVEPRDRGQPLKLSRLNKSPTKTIDGLTTATRLKAEEKRAAAVNRGAGKRSRISSDAPAAPAPAEIKATEAATLQKEAPADARAHMMRSNVKQVRRHEHERSALQIQRSYHHHQVHAFPRDMERQHAIVRLQVAVRKRLDRKHDAVQPVQSTMRPNLDLWNAQRANAKRPAVQPHARREVETDRMVAPAAFALGGPRSNVSLGAGCVGAESKAAEGALLPWESRMHRFFRSRPAVDVRAVPVAPARVHPKRVAPVLRGPNILGQGARPYRQDARDLDPVERQLHEGAEGALPCESGVHRFSRSRPAEDMEVEDALDGMECGARSAMADVMGAAILTPTKTKWSKTEWSHSRQDLVPQQQDEGTTVVSDYELTIVSDYEPRKEGDDGGGSGMSSGVSWSPEGPNCNDPDAPRSAAHGMLHKILATGKKFGRSAWDTSPSREDESSREGCGTELVQWDL